MTPAQLSPLCDVFEARFAHYKALASEARKHTRVELLHKFRIASRRLEAVEPLLRTGSKACAWRKELRAWRKAPNRLRDTHVLQERFGDEPLPGASLRRQADGLQAEWEKRREGLGRPEFMQSVDRNLRAFRARSGDSPDTVTAHFLDYWADLMHKAVKRQTACDTLKFGALHRLRVTYKAVRYMVEVLDEAGLVDAPEPARLKYWQNLLGDIQDIHVALNWLESAQPDHSSVADLKEQVAELKRRFELESPRLRALLDELDDSICRALSGSCSDLRYAN